MDRKTFLPLLAALLLVAVLTSGCGGTGDTVPGTEEQKPVVVATIYPVWEFARQVCGDRARVVQLVPDGAEPHGWEPAPRDLVDLENADVFIYNGAEMEAWVTKILANLSTGDTVLVDCSRNIEVLEVEDGTGTDPHIWLDPLNAVVMVENIRRGMEQAAPELAAEFGARSEAYQARLRQLHEDYAGVASRAKQRQFVVSHAAYGYLAHRYGLEQVPVAGITHEAQPGAARIARVVRTMRDGGIKFIFSEELASPRAVQAIAEETGARILTLNPLGGLTTSQKESGLDYIGVMEQNLAHLSLALEVD